MIMVTRVTLTITTITIMPSMITAKLHVRAMTMAPRMIMSMGTTMVMSTGRAMIMLAISMIMTTITINQATSTPLIHTVPRSRAPRLQ